MPKDLRNDPFSKCQLTGGSWNPVQRSGFSVNLAYSVDGNVIEITGGDTIGALVYAGNDGPPEGPLANDCIGSEIAFDYQMVEGFNSGFYFSIPSGSASDVDAIIGAGIEVQLGGPQLYDQNKRTLDELYEKLNVAHNAEDSATVEVIQSRIATFRSYFPGGLYGRGEPNNNRRANLNSGWNSVKIHIDKRDDGQDGLNVVVFINSSKITDRDLSGTDMGHGGIALQAYADTEVHFRNVRWREMSTSGN